MTKEQKIDMLVAMLSPLVFDSKSTNDDTAPQITFLSSTEVQLEESPGIQLPVIKEYTDNPLKILLKKITDYYYEDEEKNWQECCGDEGLDEEVDLDETYVPTFCPDHIFHTIHLLKELAENIPEETNGSNINYFDYLASQDFLQFIQHQYDLKECHPSPMEIAIAAFGNIDNAICEFNKTNQ